MSQDRFTVVALPYSRDKSSEFHVSLFVSPQLVPDGGEAPLDDFRVFREWAAQLLGAKIELANQNGPLPTAALLDKVEADAWSLVFPPDTPVRSTQSLDWGNRQWRTFRAAEVHDTAKLISAVAMAFNPTAPGAPDRELDPLVALVNRRLDLPEDLSLYDESSVTAGHDEAVGEPLRAGDVTPLPVIEKRLSATRGIDRAFLELHRARRFYERPESASADPRPRPIEGATRDPLDKPDPDFHERVSLLGDHPGVLRKLGLVIDLRVEDLKELAQSEWLTATITLDNGVVSLTARTACAVAGDHMVTVPRSEEWVAGQLLVGDAQLFGVLDMDVDGAALKTDRFLWTIPRLLRTAENQGEATTATPAHRTGGFTVVRHNRALETQARIAGQGALGQNIISGSVPLLNTEDVSQGYRVEVFDETVGRWATLHARRVDAEVLDHGTVLKDVPDEGFVQTTTATETAGVEEPPVHVHEAMFSWGGWSLSAPRPGKRVRHEAGDEIVEDPDVDPDPVTPIVLHSRVEPGTLPRLRYGRSYAFRVWGVDLAGNSRPHDMNPPPPPQQFVNQVAAALSSPRGRGGPPGLETELLNIATASVINRRNRPEERATIELNGAPLTGSAAVDASVLARLQSRRSAPRTRMGRSDRLAAVDRSSLVTRAFEDAILDGDTPLLVEPVAFDPEVVAGALDPVVEFEPRTALAVTELRPFLRWEPVQPPAVVARHNNSAGESLLQLVIRSGVTQDPETLEIEVTPPDDYAAAHPGHNYRGTSQRHLVPPKSSQYESELHGAFDEAIGSTDPNDHKKLLAIAVREAGTLFDVDVPRLDDPNVRDPQPGIALVNDPGVPASTLKTLPLPAGDPPAPGQYIVHDIDEVRVPYLPDPVAHGISLVFPDAGRDRQLVFPFGVEGFTARYGGNWPERRSFRLLLEDATDLRGDLKGHALHIGLPPGDVQRFRLSSSLRSEDLDLFGFWRSLPEAVRNIDVIAEAAADGWLWILTPFDKVTLVHAVPRPLEAPTPTVLRPFRAKDSTDAALIGGIDVHGPSTEMLTAEATWTEYTDDLSLPLPESTDVGGVGFTSVVRPEEDLAILVGGVASDLRIEIPGLGPVWFHRAVHQWGDTKHRQVTYRFRASTRYREYFDPDTLVPGPVSPGGEPAPFDDGQSVVGPETTLSVPSSARPAPPIIHSVLPLLRWDVGTEPEQPVALRSQRQAGVRIYLERPWFSSGEGELLAVLVAPGGIDVGSENHVSQWGADPIWRASQVPRRGMWLEFDNLISTLGLDTRPGDARPVAPPVSMPYDAVPKSPPVTVLGYQPQFNEERGLWYVDIAIDPGDKFWPFVRLAVARYQPDSINGCHLSEPVKCDFVQLLPDRTTSVSRTDIRHVRVVVSGPVGTRGGGKDEKFPPPPVLADEAVRRNRRLVARLQRVDPNIPTDLGWDTVDTVELRVRGSGRTSTEAAWVGELASPVNIPLRKPGRGSKWRVAIEEWELLRGDPADLGERGPRITERRLIYADEIML